MSVSIASGVSLAPYTTFKIGGTAEFFAEVYTKEELGEALAYAQDKQLAITVLGGGSNVLVADEGVPGLVIVMKNTELEVVKLEEEVRITAGAGMVWDDLVLHCVEQGWWGMENLSGIPGSVGAVPVQNVGAYGVEVAFLISEVRAVHKDTLEEKIFDVAACAFGYRDSFFKSAAGRAYVIYEVSFRLSIKPCPRLRYKDLAGYFANDLDPALSDIREAILTIRSEKFPDLRVCGTAGSFFKNPVVLPEVAAALAEQFPDIPVYPAGDKKKLSAAWLIDKATGLRGVTRGAVGTHGAQALVVVNHGGATAKDVAAFASFIITEVQAKTGVMLEPEVRFIP